MSATENAQELADGRATVTGDVAIAAYPGRGKVMVFGATSAAAIVPAVNL